MAHEALPALPKTLFFFPFKPSGKTHLMVRVAVNSSASEDTEDVGEDFSKGHHSLGRGLGDEVAMLRLSSWESLRCCAPFLGRESSLMPLTLAAPAER
jgi:hypothetical protein